MAGQGEECRFVPNRRQTSWNAVNECLGLKSTTENLAVLLTVYKRSVYRLVDGQ